MSDAATRTSDGTDHPEDAPTPPGELSGHAGELAVAVARAHGVETMFTLSGAHVFPLYDGAVKADPPMRLLDVRHEATAVFAAEATAKLTRRPGLAVLTAGPGVTNGVSAITTAYFNGTPVVVLGGRAPAARWGSGSLQELDHPPILSGVTKHAGTAGRFDDIPRHVAHALRVATMPHRGPVFLDLPIDAVYAVGTLPAPSVVGPVRLEPDPDDLAVVARLLAAAAAPVLVLGSDVWTDGAEEAARRFTEAARVPVVANGMGRGVVPASSDLNVSRARGRRSGPPTSSSSPARRWTSGSASGRSGA